MAVRKMVSISVVARTWDVILAVIRSRVARRWVSSNRRRLSMVCDNWAVMAWASATSSSLQPATPSRCRPMTPMTSLRSVMGSASSFSLEIMSLSCTAVVIGSSQAPWAVSTSVLGAR